MRFNLNPFMRNVDKEIFFPVQVQPPESITSTTTIYRTSNTAATAEYKILTIVKAGWYIMGAYGSTGGKWAGAGGGAGGARQALVYLYEGSKVLMWGAQDCGVSGHNTRTGYPIPTGNGAAGAGSGQYGALGGGGATPGNYGEDGGGGGGAGGNGGNEHYDGGYGGGGAGIIAGLDTVLDHTESFACGDIYSVKTVIAMVLGGGGGGGCGDNNTPRVGGAGGGAWGNGGSITGTGWAGGGGPGGTFGAGQSKTNANYSGGSAGGWCVRDFSTGLFESGTGYTNNAIGSVGASFARAGQSYLLWVNDQGPYEPAITTKIDLGSVGGGVIESRDFGAITAPVSDVIDCYPLAYPEQ